MVSVVIEAQGYDGPCSSFVSDAKTKTLKNWEIAMLDGSNQVS